MTFQVWGWRREDASQVLAWVPDAEGGRRGVLTRRSLGEPAAMVLGGPRPLGSLAGGKGQEEKQGRGWSWQGAGTGPGSPRAPAAGFGGRVPAGGVLERSWGVAAV